MSALLVNLFAGLMCGIVFALFKLPIPAPPTYEAVLGLLGVFIGYKVVVWISLSL